MIAALISAKAARRPPQEVDRLRIRVAHQLAGHTLARQTASHRVVTQDLRDRSVPGRARHLDYCVAVDVDVVFRKYSGSLHRRITMRRLGEDEHGTWLGAPAGTMVHSDAPGQSFANQHATVRLVPTGQWWTAIFFAEPSAWDVYCDITTPAQWLHPSAVAMVDLDLDVLRTRNGGRTDLLDEDEFEANSATYGYPAEIVASAHSTAHRLGVDLASGTEPFGTSYRSWLSLIF